MAGDWTEATGRRVGSELLRHSDRPTAIFAANDLSAVGVLAAADELGLRVPDDVSVVGYDNTVFARLLRLSLIVDRQPHRGGGTGGRPHPHGTDQRRQGNHRDTPPLPRTDHALVNRATTRAVASDLPLDELSDAFLIGLGRVLSPRRPAPSAPHPAARPAHRARPTARPSWLDSRRPPAVDHIAVDGGRARRPPGLLTCPSCTTPLRPWGDARARPARPTVDADRPGRSEGTAHERGLQARGRQRSAGVATLRPCPGRQHHS